MHGRAFVGLGHVEFEEEGRRYKGCFLTGVVRVAFLRARETYKTEPQKGLKKNPNWGVEPDTNAPQTSFPKKGLWGVRVRRMSVRKLRQGRHLCCTQCHTRGQITVSLRVGTYGARGLYA